MTLSKSVLRTIRRSIGRYLAILLITALGVGFFSGLRVSEKAMLETVGEYVNEMNLYDFRLLSTLGLTDDDVAAFSSLDGIKDALGSVTGDFIYEKEDGSEAVYHAHTLHNGINGVDVKAGRLPEKADECVIDSRYNDESKIGTVITLSPDNSDETKALFSCNSYTVVGIINSSEYINFERGSTSLAGGTVSGFLYLLPEGFSSDYYTEIFLTLDGEHEIYSDEYESAVDEMRAKLEPLIAERGEIRYESIYGDAKKEIENAENELNGKKKELDDALTAIADGECELEDKKAETQKSLDEAKAQLDAAKKQIDEGRAALEYALSQPTAAIPEVKAQLDETSAALDYSEGEYEKNLAEYSDAVNTVEAKFSDAEKKLADSRSEAADAEAKIKEAESEIDDAYAKLDEIKKPTTYVLDRSSNIGYAALDNDTKIVSGISKVFPLFFFLVAALVCITTMTRMVGEHRTENGTLKALGYGSARIASQYLFYACSASIIGCVFGFLVGSRYMPMVLWKIYHIMYSIDRPIKFVLDMKLFIICTVLYLTASLGATWLVCHTDLTESAASLIRPKSPAAGKRILLERIPFIWKRIKFLHKVSIRNILRYKKRMVMMIIGIGGCTALLLTGFGIRDTIKPIVDRQYNEIYRYDAAVSFLEALDADGEKKLAEEYPDYSFAFCHTGSAEIFADGKSSDISLVVFDGDLDGFISLHSSGEKIPFPENGGAVINYRFASENGISVGDTLRVTDGNGNPFDVTVSGIFDNYIYDFIYVSSETYKNAVGSDAEINSAYSVFPDGEDDYVCGAELLGNENVSNVMLSADMRTRVKSMLESLDYVVLIVLVCAGTLAFIVMYNLTNITITERTREIATLKVLGFYRKEQNSYVFRENIVLTVISALCGIPMGIALLHYVMAQIKISSIYFGCRLDTASYFIAILITIGFTLIVDLALTAKTERINMAEAMKAVE